MEKRKQLYVTDREAWRTWLAEHHASESEIWLVYYKKESGRPRIPYDDAVEEALCFGWIDSIVKTIDDEKFSQKFTPRRNTAKWSELNKQRVRKLMRDGRMTDAGLAKVDLTALGSESATARGETNVDVPPFIKREFRKNTAAWRNFRSASPSRQKAYVRMILDAKQEETRQRRLREAIELLEQAGGSTNEVPSFVKQALMKNTRAWENFQKLAPSHRRHYVGWIMQAKKEETRERRLKEAISLLSQNKKLGLK